jgi:hypothetical protein
MTTPHLAIPHILQSQAQKEVTANAAFDALDQAIAGLLEVDISPGGTITVDPAAAIKCKLLRLTGTLAAEVEVVVPDNPKPYFVHNDTGGSHAVTVRTHAGAGLTIGSGANNTVVVYCDGTDGLAISAGMASSASAGALIQLDDTAIAPRSIAVTLANHDAETGDTSGWTTTGTGRGSRRGQDHRLPWRQRLLQRYRRHQSGDPRANDRSPGGGIHRCRA